MTQTSYYQARYEVDMQEFSYSSLTVLAFPHRNAGKTVQFTYPL